MDELDREQAESRASGRNKSVWDRKEDARAAEAAAAVAAKAAAVDRKRAAKAARAAASEMDELDREQAESRASGRNKSVWDREQDRKRAAVGAGVSLGDAAKERRRLEMEWEAEQDAVALREAEQHEAHAAHAAHIAQPSPGSPGVRVDLVQQERARAASTLQKEGVSGANLLAGLMSGGGGGGGGGGGARVPAPPPPRGTVGAVANRRVMGGGMGGGMGGMGGAGGAGYAAGGAGVLSPDQLRAAVMHGGAGRQ